MSKRKKPLLLRVEEVQPGGTRKAKTVRHDELKQQQEPRHKALSAEQMKRAITSWEQIGKYARPSGTLGEWLDGFRYDQHPDNEMAAWERIGNTFEKVNGPSMSPEHQR